MERILLISILINSKLYAFSLPFTPEIGDYKYNMNQVLNAVEGSGFIFKSNHANIPNVKYQLNEVRNEFQIENWYSYDWYNLQNNFELDELRYMKLFNEKYFNTAKRKDYSNLIFDNEDHVYHKINPVPKEWGGLTHPPLRELRMSLSDYDERFYEINYPRSKSAFYDYKFQIKIDKISQTELSFKNKLHLLADHQSFLSKKKMIKEAKSSIFLSSLVFVCDSSSKEIRDLLIEKKKEGVDVFVIVDYWITTLTFTNECPVSLKQSGINLIYAKNNFNLNEKSIYHTKVLVVDLKQAVAGGHNLINADNLSLGTNFMNRDLDLYMEGPIALDVASSFLEDWQFFSSKDRDIGPSVDHYVNEVNRLKNEQRALGLRGEKFYESYFLDDFKKTQSGACRFIKQNPFNKKYTIGKTYLQFLENTKTHLVFTDPIRSDTINDSQFKYFMYNKLHRKVIDLAKNGLPIDYITTNIDMAGNENVAIMNELIKQDLKEGNNLLANFHYLRLFLSNKYYGPTHYQLLFDDWVKYKNIHVYANISFMHSKVFYFDRIISSVGSFNFNQNSSDESFESTTVCIDENLNKELDRTLLLDMANSIPLVKNETY